MGYSAKQRKVKTKVEGADKLVKDIRPVDTVTLKAILKLNDGKVTETKATVSVDYDKSLRYGTFVELGARGRPANPFLRNAVDGNIDKINDEIVKAISNAVGRKL